MDSHNSDSITGILIGHLADAVKDPLACKLRYELRIRNDKQGAGGGGGGGYLEGIQVVYSYEKSRVKLASLDRDQEANPEKYASMPAKICPLSLSLVVGSQPPPFRLACDSIMLTSSFFLQNTILIMIIGFPFLFSSSSSPPPPGMVLWLILESGQCLLWVTCRHCSG